MFILSTGRDTRPYRVMTGCRTPGIVFSRSLTVAGGRMGVSLASPIDGPTAEGESPGIILADSTRGVGSDGATGEDSGLLWLIEDMAT